MDVNREKERYEDISRFFLTSQSLLEHVMAIFSYQETSVQAVLAANIAADLVRRGRKVIMIDLVEDFPNTRWIFQREETVPSLNRFGASRASGPVYADDCVTPDDVMQYLTRKDRRKDVCGEPEKIIILNLPYEPSRAFWQILCMARFLLVLTGDRIEDLMRTDQVVRMQCEKKTPFSAGIVFSRSSSRSDTDALFRKLSASFPRLNNHQLLNLGRIDSHEKIFHSLLAGRLVVCNSEEPDSCPDICRIAGAVSEHLGAEQIVAREA
jgi:MinD-like ATPase involved in chromosome partitioning or flagellar assembly